jgi:DinB family protein
MNPKIEILIQRSGELHFYFKDLLNQLTLPQLDYRENDTKWSIAEIIYHVYLSEKLPCNFMINFSFERKNQVLGIKARIRSLILNIVLNSKLKFKAPVNAIENFPEVIDPQELINKWDRSNKEFLDYLENFNSDKLKNFIFKHPLAGKLNILQTLEFINSHMVHHKKQIERIKKLDNFPK